MQVYDDARVKMFGTEALLCYLDSDNVGHTHGWPSVGF
jgi:hypothetical protein